MNFELSPEQIMLRDTVAAFAKQRSPVARFRELRKGPDTWDRTVWHHMGELGWLGVGFAEEDGGMGGDAFDRMIILEGFGRALVPEPFIASVVLAGSAIAAGGSTEQRARWLAPMIDGRTSLALAYAERDNRFDHRPRNLRATRDGAQWRLDGEKIFALNGADADATVVSATTGDTTELFVVERDTPGVEVRALRTIDEHGAANLVFRGTPVEDAQRLAVEDADALLDHVLDHARAATCAEAVGVARASLELTRTHLKEREQFGVPIGAFQVLQHRAVDMFVQVELMHSMAILAAGHAGHPDPDQRRLSVSAAKAYVARSGRAVTQAAIQLHGGIGITDEHDIGLYFKRMHALSTMFGDAVDHVRRFASQPGFTSNLE